MDEFAEWGSLGPQSLKGSPVVLHLYVADADATLAQAVTAGAKVVMPLADMFWGDRYGRVEAPFGHRWSIATHQRDATPEELAAGAAMPSRAERDRINAAVMAAPRMQPLMNEENPPFDCKRMAYGGFTPLVVY